MNKNPHEESVGIPRSKRDSVEAWLLLVAGLLYIWAWVVLATEDLDTSWYLSEDGPIEHGTAVALIAGAIYSIVRGIKVRPILGNRALVTGLILGVVLFFGAGEELGWCQEQLGYEIPQFFTKYNEQNDVTIHNLAFGWFAFNFFIFGPHLILGAIAYAFWSQRAWHHSPKFRRLATDWDIPVPRWRHAVLLALITIMEIILVLTKIGGLVKDATQEHSEFAVCWVLFFILFNRQNWNAKSVISSLGPPKST